MNELIYLYLPIGILFNLFLYGIILKLGWVTWQNPRSNNRRDYHTFLFCILLLSIFSYTGDFYHYYIIYTGQGRFSTVETIYESMIPWSCGFFHLWRLFIWGSALFLICKFCRVLRLNPRLVLFIFLSYGIIFFVNGRVSLAQSILYFGFALLISNNRSKLKLITGISLILISIIFHKSVIFGVAVIILSCIVWRINKFTIILCLCLIPIIIIAFKYVLTNVLSMDASILGDQSQIVSSAQGYIARDNTEYGGGRMIQKYLLWIDYGLWIWLLIKIVKTGLYRQLNTSKRLLVNYAFFSMLISSIFFIDLGFGTRILQLRFSEFAYLPMAANIAVSRQFNFEPKLLRAIIIVGIMQSVYNYIYMLYVSILNPILV